MSVDLSVSPFWQGLKLTGLPQSTPPTPGAHALSAFQLR